MHVVSVIFVNDPYSWKCSSKKNIDLSAYPNARRQISDWSKLKQSADENFEFDENTRKLSKRVENTVGKREIARCEQFLLFTQCFQKACFPGASKVVIVWEWAMQATLADLSPYL